MSFAYRKTFLLYFLEKYFFIFFGNILLLISYSIIFAFTIKLNAKLPTN